MSDKDRFRGQCALALDANAKIALSLANAIRISPMHGCTDLGAIDYCRVHIKTMNEWLDKAEESARAVRDAEARHEPEHPEAPGDLDSAPEAPSINPSTKGKAAPR